MPYAAVRDHKLECRPSLSLPPLGSPSIGRACCRRECSTIEQVFEFELERWFARTWLSVGREADFETPGTYALVDVAGESVIVVRGRDGVLRAFHNVCRHRGSTLVDPAR